MKEENSIFYEIKHLDKLIFRSVAGSFGKEATLISQTQMQILSYMIKNIQKDIYQKDLENVLHLRRATVSGVLKTMEKNKLIERVKNEDDIRGKKIILNAKARELFEEGKRKVKKLEKVAIKDISKESLDVFYSVIKKMRLNIEESEENNA